MGKRLIEKPKMRDRNLEWREVTSGVFKDSLLVPVMFLTYISDMH